MNNVRMPIQLSDQLKIFLDRADHFNHSALYSKLLLVNEILPILELYSIILPY